jgi:hypothetical protein
MQARLGLGDVAGAVHELQSHRRVLVEELGIEPAAELFELFRGTVSIERLRRDESPTRVRRSGRAALPKAGAHPFNS